MKLNIEVETTEDAELAIEMLTAFLRREKGASTTGKSKKTPIEDLGLSVRAFNLLTGAKILTVEELARHSRENLSEIEGMGRVSLDDIEDCLGRAGRALRA